MIIGTGVDVVEIARIRRVLEKSENRFISRVFTPAEQQFCDAHRDPAPHYSVRFAAKEALFKALGTGWAKGVTWLDVEIRRERKDAPTIMLQREAQRLSTNLGVRAVHLSLSHSEHYAVAMVILEG